MNKKIGILYKQDDESRNYARSFIEQSNFECVELSERDKVDLIVCFGGDGTFLRCVDYACKYQAPIVSVNTGNLGFLSCYNKDEISLLIKKIKDNALYLEKKRLFKVVYKNKSRLFFNDVSVQRESSPSFNSEVVTLGLYAKNKPVEWYSADGIVISTPAGSTAYSLSAGGAILVPDLKGVIAAPLLAHSLYSKPIVFPDSAKLTVKAEKAGVPCNIFADGRFFISISEGESADVYKSTKTISVATNSDFYKKLNTKLNNWGVKR